MKRQKQGVALITMLLLLALVTALTADMLYQNTLEIKRQQTQRRLAQATEYAFGGIVLAELWLQQSVVTHSARPTVFQPPDGSLTIEIDDEMAKFNINNLRTKEGGIDQTQLAVLKRLLTSFALDPSLAYGVADWLDKDISSSGYNTEDLGYATIKTRDGIGYRAANRAMTNISELILVRGFSPNIVENLKPSLTALPMRTPINVNSARPIVIEAVIPGINGQTLFDMRKQNISGFADLNSLLQHQLTAGLDIPTQWLTTSSQFYLITARAAFQQQRAQWQALVSRTIKPDTTDQWQTNIVWLRQLPFWATAAKLNNYE